MTFPIRLAEEFVTNIALFLVMISPRMYFQRTTLWLWPYHDALFIYIPLVLGISLVPNNQYNTSIWILVVRIDF